MSIEKVRKWNGQGEAKIVVVPWYCYRCASLLARRKSSSWVEGSEDLGCRSKGLGWLAMAVQWRSVRVAGRKRELKTCDALTAKPAASLRQHHSSPVQSSSGHGRVSVNVDGS